MKIKLSQNSINWLESNNISFDNRFRSRLAPGDEIIFLDELSIEPYVGYHGGLNIFEQGYMSYSNSNLPLDIKIGRYCSLAWGISFISWNHPYECLSTSVFAHDRQTDLTVRAIRDFSSADTYNNFVQAPQKPQVEVEHDVWVGQNATLAAGIKIGIGSIIAANSVVTKNVEPYSIVGGNPAKLIKYRFPKEIIDRLLTSKWWEYNFIDFYNFDISNINNFLTNFENNISNIEIYKPPRVVMKNIPF